MQTATVDQLQEELIDYRGKSVPKSKSGIPLITAKNIRRGFIDFTEAEYISNHDYDGWSSKGYPATNDVLITTEAPLGMVALFPQGKYAIAQRVICIRPKQNVIDPEYLMYFLLSHEGQKRLQRRSSGSTALGIKQSELRKIKIDFPSLDKQQEIKRILSTWDEAIEAVEELIEKNEKLFRSFLYKTVRKKNKPNYKLREIAKVKHGKSQKKVENKSGKYPILATGGVIGYADEYLTSEPSVLIGRKGTIDKPGFMDEPFWHVDTLFRLETNSKVLPKWLYYYFLTVNWQAHSQGAVLPSLTGSSVGSIKLFLPTIDEQRHHVQLLDVIESKISYLKKKKKLFSKQKKGLMQKILTSNMGIN